MRWILIAPPLVAVVLLSASPAIRQKPVDTGRGASTRISDHVKSAAPNALSGITWTGIPSTMRAGTSALSVDRVISGRTEGSTQPGLGSQQSTSPRRQSRALTVAARTSRSGRVFVRPATSSSASTVGTASQPTGADARSWSRRKLPAWWLRQAMCVHHFETYGARDPGAWHDRRNPLSRGGMQFLRGTWESVGGHGDPADASRGEQLYRAWLVWKRDGGSWHEWSTSRVCGLA